MGQRMMIAITAAIVSVAIAAAQTPRAQPAAPAASAAKVELSIEPSRSAAVKTPATLSDAAVANDYASFDILVRKAKANHEDLGAFADLYDVWSFSQSNATGAYYGGALHDRLAARYPDYARFIVEYRITDNRGQAFYPSAATRSFLLQQAIDGNDPIVASTAHATPPVSLQRIAAPARSATHSASSREDPAATAATPIEPRESVPNDALASDMSKVTPEERATAATHAKPLEAQMIDTAGTTRGIFLVILGLIGIGVLTMTMQASSSDIHVADEEEWPTAAVKIAANPEVHPTQSHG